MLKALHEFDKTPQTRTQTEMEAELAEIRQSGAPRRPETPVLILLDTSVLIAALTSPRLLLADLEKVIHRGEHQLIVPTLVLYEWWRGPNLGRNWRSRNSFFRRRPRLGSELKRPSWPLGLPPSETGEDARGGSGDRGLRD